MQEYSAYCKKKWCPAGGKDPLIGRVDGFQIDPNMGSPLQEKSKAFALQIIKVCNEVILNSN